MDISIRDARAEEERFLWTMLTFAASMEMPGEQSIDEARSDSTISGHVEGWGKEGDTGVVASGHDGKLIGAAWVRLGVPGASEYEFGDEQVPELAMAVVPEARGKGVGESLLRELLLRCRGKYPAVVLSVREDNSALRLYQKVGFSVTSKVVNRVGATSFVMRIELQPVSR